MTEHVYTGVVLDDQTELTLNQLCTACSTSAEWVIELVAEGVLEPAGQERSHWRFQAISLVRAHAAMRLQQDLGINVAGIALALDLLDEIDALRARLGRFDSGRSAED